MQNSLKFYLQQRKKLLAFQYANFLIGWDNNTEAPPKSFENSAEQTAVLSEMQYNLTTDPKFINAVQTLFEHRDQLDDALKQEIVLLKKSNDRFLKTPVDKYVAFQQLQQLAIPVYVEAKTTGDFKKFQPYLEKIIDYKRHQTQWYKTDDLEGYNIHLDMYEPNFPKSKYDEFFAVLKEKLVPFVKQVTQKTLDYDFSFAEKTYDIEKQREFCQYLRDVLCFDKQRGIMKQSEHPFTSGFGTDDVRITVHYYPDNFVSSIFSCIHETGHALYQAQVDPSLNGTFCCDGASMGMHESQSRFYENIIGRSGAFWEVHFEKLQSLFPENLKNVSVETFVAYINRVENSFVRIEADELTYPLHIMLRYEMEQAFIEGDLKVSDFPSYWNKLFFEYFGKTPPNDTLGVLQDIHWAGGDVGYFPTYALGSAMACQLYDKMNIEFDVEKSLKEGNTKKINQWLQQKVHKFGQTKYPMDILISATGKPFDANHYVQYLISKYSKLYGI